MSAEAAGPRKFEFPSHQSHLLTLAKMCKESKEFTDCIIQCDEGDNLKAHRLVLGSASSFLKTVFQDLPTSLAEATIVVPGVKRGIVESLLNFLYTGEMTVDRKDTSDLQLLIDTLQIDPSLISVSASKESKEVSEPKRAESTTSKEGGTSEPENQANNSKRKRKVEENDDDDDEEDEKKQDAKKAKD